MINRTKVVLIILSLSLLAGCSSFVIKDQSAPINTDEAIILVKINAPSGDLFLSTTWLEDLYTVPRARQISLKDGENLLALKLKKEKVYKISRYDMKAFSQLIFRFDEPVKFKSTSDCMTYIGDINIEGKYSTSHINGVGVSIIDNEVETNMKLKQKYPILFKKYCNNKLLAK